MAPRKAWHSIHVDKELPPIPQTKHSSVFSQAGLEGSIVSGGKWKGPKQNHEVVDHGPPFPHSFLSHETCLKWLSRKLPTKAYFRSYYRIELLHLQFFTKPAQPPTTHTKKIHSLFH